MTKAIDFTDETYALLEEMSRKMGFADIEHLVKKLLWEAELQRRKELGRRINKHREAMLSQYGVMKDSTELIRQDRERQ